MPHPPSIFLQGANCCEAKLPPLTKSNHSAGPLRGTPAESLSVQLGEFIYLWQAHVSSHTLILVSCQKPVQYAFPLQRYRGRERQGGENRQGEYVFMECVSLPTHQDTVHMSQSSNIMRLVRIETGKTKNS